MSKKIEILPESISQKIAAGEVVERPASVVKELMENAIDAHAQEIIVELKGGGLELIRVIDDGEGIEPEDLPVALQRFATSKIRKVEDLYSIRTLGFRGEALPSIASVSHLTIISRVAHALSGTRIVCEGGEIKSLSEIGSPVGTEVVVRNLFYNLPVKRKFLKSIRSELRYVLNYFNRISLSYPSISFKLIHDERMVEELLRTESPWIRVEALWGREILDHLREIETEEGELRLSGLMSLPSLAKGNADGIYLYVNRRYVKDRIMYKAILEAYRHHLPSGKFPFCLLFLEIPPSFVDVNVHPTKAEVKFKEPERIYRLVFNMIHHILEGKTERGIPVSLEKREGYGEPSFPLKRDFIPPTESRGEEITPFFGLKEERPLWGEEKRFRIIGQLWETYILCENEENLVLIDQHAAHERVLFEKWKKKVENHSLGSNPLLIPILLECSHEESIILEEVIDTFRTIGFELEPIGERLYAIRAIPELLQPEESKPWIREILEELSFLRRGDEGKNLIETLLISLSCHSSVRGRGTLRREEMEELVKSLSPFELSLTCPHGRPIFYFIPRTELEKQFKRRRKGS